MSLESEIAPKERELTLLERIAGGDSQAIPLLLDAYGALVWSIVRKQIGADQADDLTQEIFIRIWKDAARYDPQLGSEATFITMIARRRVIDFRRRVGRRPESVEIADDAGAPDRALERVDLADEARVAAAALSQLRPEQQQVLRLAIVDGLTHTEIASATNLPLGTVKSHARRGMERVRTLLAAESKKGGAPK